MDIANLEAYVLPQDELQELLDQRPGPTVSLEGIHEKIREVTFYTHQHMTICVVELLNGFFLLGKAAPVDPLNFNPDIGIHYAFQDAVRKGWEVEGYLLRNNLYEASRQ